MHPAIDGDWTKLVVQIFTSLFKFLDFFCQDAFYVSYAQQCVPNLLASLCFHADFRSKLATLLYL